MAGDWLKFEKATLDKPEVFAIAATLDIDPDAVVGKLLRVWSWFDTHTESGNAKSVTSLLLDRIAGATGFSDAMAEVGWLEASAGGVSLPAFDRHNGQTAKARAETARRVALHRSAGKSTPPACNGNIVTSALAREEKRREEEQKLKATDQQADQGKLPDEDLAGIAKPAAPVPMKRKAQTDTKFIQFWAAYPVKKGKADAKKKWKLKGCDAIADQIIEHVRRMEREDDDWLRGFIPHGSTYINGERWEDEPKRDKVATTPARAPESFGSKAAMVRSESKLENALGYIREQLRRGAYGEGEAASQEAARLSAEATEKYRGQ